MMPPITQAGDVLLYFRSPNPIDLGIDLFEWFEHHGEPRYFYHCAVALGPGEKIEADRRISIKPIQIDNSYLVFRPPIPKGRISTALRKLRTQVGKRYGYMLILDDALRYISGGCLHVPIRFMKRYRDNDCSSLLAFYFCLAMWGPKLEKWCSPVDIWLAVKEHPVVSDL